MKQRAALLFVFLLLLSSIGEGVERREDSFTVIRKRAHDVLTKHCGSCHLPGLLTTNQNALKIFNLGTDSWFLNVDEKRMQAMLGRLKSRESMSQIELLHLSPKGGPSPVAPTSEEIQDFSYFVTSWILNNPN
tara:strand:+ start:3357 stop:3755 length:399 start_codon:yes stop_codon:yes gene_type:complete